MLDGFGVEEVGELVGGHATACIVDGDLDKVGAFGGADADAPTLVCELAGIVGQRVEHKEGEHLIGLNNGIGGFDIELDALHLERGAALGYQVEELLQGEALDMEAELTLAQLDPVGEHIVVGVDLIGKFAHVGGIARGRLYFVEDAIDEGGNAVDERHFGTLFEIAALAALHAQLEGLQLFALLFEEVVDGFGLRVLLIEVVEEPQGEAEHDDGCHDGPEHEVEL